MGNQSYVIAHWAALELMPDINFVGNFCLLLINDLGAVFLSAIGCHYLVLRYLQEKLHQ